MIRAYFPEVLAIEQLRTMFRKYCIELHPDKPGGDQAKFCQMKDEYDHILRLASASEAGRASAEKRDAAFDFAGEKELAEALEKLLNIPGIDVEICFKWLWISGNSFPVHERIRAVGCSFAPKKKVWFFAPPQYRRARNRKPWSMEKIRSKYGSEIRNTDRSHTFRSKRNRRTGLIRVAQGRGRERRPGGINSPLRSCH